jgi:hypothetical protein
MGALKIGIEDKNAIAIIAYLFREWAEMIKASHKRARKKTDPLFHTGDARRITSAN